MTAAPGLNGKENATAIERYFLISTVKYPERFVAVLLLLFVTQNCGGYHCKGGKVPAV